MNKQEYKNYLTAHNFHVSFCSAKSRLLEKVVAGVAKEPLVSTRKVLEQIEASGRAVDYCVLNFIEQVRRTKPKEQMPLSVRLMEYKSTNRKYTTLFGFFGL